MTDAHFSALISTTKYALEAAYARKRIFNRLAIQLLSRLTGFGPAHIWPAILGRRARGRCVLRGLGGCRHFPQHFLPRRFHHAFIRPTTPMFHTAREARLLRDCSVVSESESLTLGITLLVSVASGFLLVATTEKIDEPC